MNIFVSSISPVTSARNLDDKRVIKLALEAAQLLAAVAEAQGIETPYKRTKQGRVFQEWMLERRAHYEWVRQHFAALCGEYTYRTGRVHKCEIDILPILPAYPRSFRVPKTWVNYAAKESIGVCFHHLPVPLAYREYLNARWPGDKRTPKWTRRKPPTWANLDWAEDAR